MQVLHRDSPMIPPNICCLCELSPDRDVIDVVDTLYDFSPPSLTHLNGRKYVCEPCVSSLVTAWLQDQFVPETEEII